MEVDASAYDEKLVRIQKKVETALLEQTQSVIKDRRDIWKSIAKLERMANDVKTKVSLLSVDFENSKGSLSSGSKKDPKQFYRTTGSDHLALKAEVSELTRRLVQLEFFCKGSSSDPENLKKLEGRRKPSISGRLSIIEDAIIGNLQKNTTAFGTSTPTTPVKLEETTFPNDVPRKPSVLSPKSTVNYGGRRASSASSFSLASPEGSPKPSGAPIPGHNQFKVELRRLTSYVQELWERDQDKFNDLIEVFQSFNNRLSTVEKILEKSGLLERGDSENDVETEVDSVQVSLQNMKAGISSSMKDKGMYRNDKGNGRADNRFMNLEGEIAAGKEVGRISKNKADDAMSDSNEKGNNSILENYTQYNGKSSDDVDDGETRNEIEPSSLYDIEESECNTTIEKMKYDLIEKERKLEEISALKTSSKLNIVKWMDEFTVTHGVEPTLKDKNEVRDLYVEYKNLSQMKKEVVEDFCQLKGNIFSLEQNNDYSDR